MLKFLKFLLGFIVLIALLLLVNVSFFSGDNKNIDKITFKEFKNTSKYSNYINYLDSVISYEDSDIEINENNNIIEIILEEGTYILDLNDISKKYKIKGNGFEIEVKGVGDIYIDTSLKKNFIFSLNSSFVLKFLNKKQEYINSYFMYPHEWIKFNSSLNFIYKKSDLYRIRTTTKNGYFKESLNEIEKNKVIYENFLGKENKILFDIYIKNKKEIYKQNNLIYKQIFLLKSSQFPFSNYINEYRQYFINDSKKSAYLQNNIYNNIVLLIQQRSENKELLENITKELSELKSIDINKYNNIEKFIKDIYKVFILNKNIGNINKIESLLYLLNDNINILNIKNYLLLHNIYFNYDFIGLKNFIQYFNLFLNNYLENSGIIEKNENFVLNKQEKLIEVESFIFFLRGYINSHLFLGSLSDFSYQVNILSTYVRLNTMIYFSNDLDSKKIRTSLKQNKNLLSKLEIFLRKIFFEDQRDNKRNILILKKGNKIKFDDFNFFEKSINSLFLLFNKNKSNTDFVLDYEKLFNSFKEEFLAIKDYEKYNLEYEKELKNLYGIKGLGEKSEKIYYIDDVFGYLSQFSGVSFEKNDILKELEYFKIGNVFINNKNYTLKLFPNLGNKVEIYETNSNIFLLSYNLDESKRLLEDKYLGAKPEEKYKYDFKNFFSEKFKGLYNNNQGNSIEEICALRKLIPDPNSFDKCIEPKVDSDLISVFKKDKLINGEFSLINDFFLIKYNNLFIENVDGFYNISIKDSDIKLQIKDKSNIKIYKILFNSKYDFQNHLFYDISFKLKDSTRDYLFDSALVSIKFKKIKLIELKPYLEKYLSNISNLKNIYSILSSKISLNNFKIEDIFGKSYLKFKTNNKNVTIKVEKDKIFSIIVENINILENSININDLKNYIDKLK